MRAIGVRGTFDDAALRDAGAWAAIGDLSKAAAVLGFSGDFPA
jgi:hypothetical protein